MGILLHGVGAAEVGDAELADKLDLGGYGAFAVLQHQGMGFDILNGSGAVLKGAVLGHGVSHVINGKTAGYIAFGSGEEAEAVTVDGVDAITHISHGDACTGLENHDGTVGHIVGTDYESARIHSKVDAEVEAVAGAEILMGIFLDGVSAGEVLCADFADQLDLCGEVAVQVVQDQSMGLDVGNGRGTVLKGAVLSHRIGVHVLRRKDGVLLECHLAGPVRLERSTVLKEDHSLDGISVFASVFDLRLFEDVNGNVALLDVLAADGRLAEHEVAVLGNGIQGFRILVGSEEVLVADERQVHGSGPVGKVEGEDPAVRLILGCSI